jgi:hypothetical protein
MKIFSPAGYSANLTQTPGTKIGGVVAIVKAKALGRRPAPARRRRARRQHRPTRTSPTPRSPART